MKKILLMLPVIFLLATGCNPNTSQPVTQQNNSQAPAPVASSTTQIQYSSNPKVIGKELRGLTSIPDKYKPEDTVIDLGVLAEPYLNTYKADKSLSDNKFRALIDPLGRFEIEGYEMSTNNNKDFEVPVYERQLVIFYAQNQTEFYNRGVNFPEFKWSEMFRFKTKTTTGYMNRDMNLLIIKDNDASYYIAYGPELREPNSAKPFNTELFIVGSTFRLLK